MSRQELTRFDDYQAMLSDRVRMEAYAKAIEAVVQPGDIVVDLGAGLGILSLMAVRAGAEHVFAIEKSSAAELGKEIVAHNGFSDRITFIEKHSYDVELPTRARVLISETLGSFGLDESTLTFMTDARERLLRPDGVMIPQRLVPVLAPVELPAQHERLAFWKDVAGFEFEPALKASQSRMSLATVRENDLLGPAQAFVSLDFREVSGTTVRGTHLFEIGRPGALHGLGAWFEVELCEGVTISTAPDQPETHWRQGFFPFRDPIDVIAGDMLEVKLTIGPKDEDAARADDTTVHYEYRCTQLANEQRVP